MRNAGDLLESVIENRRHLFKVRFLLLGSFVACRCFSDSKSILKVFICYLDNLSAIFPVYPLVFLFCFYHVYHKFKKWRIFEKYKGCSLE